MAGKKGKKFRANVYWKGERFLGKFRSSKKQAESDERRIYVQLEDGTYVKEKAITLDEAVQEFFKYIAPNQMKTSTIKVYLDSYNLHVSPVFGKRKLNSIKPIEIQKLWNRKQSVLANASIIKMHTCLNQVFGYYVELDYLKTNPMEKVRRLPPKYKKADIWSKEEAVLFLEKAEPYKAFIAFWLALNFGLRYGECMGLMWKDINFDSKVMHIQRAYHENEDSLGSLKTANSNRKIYLSENQVTVLKKHKQNQEFDTDLVCANSLGGFFMSRNIRRVMTEICKKNGIKRITFHQLRHTHATFFLSMQESPKVISERLGHADVKTTLSIYQHVTKQIHEESSNRFDEFFYSQTS